MDKIRKIIIGLSIAGCAALAFSGCAMLDKSVSNLIGRGYNVVIEFDENGGLVAGQQNMHLEDLYLDSQLEEGIRLLPPGDARRGGEAGQMSKISRDDFFLIGWYRQRELRVDEKGNALDEYGELCSVSGRDQGYVFSGRWDFDKDVVREDMTETETFEGKKVRRFTLYAAWSPDFTYSFLRPAEEGEEGEWVEYDTAKLPEGETSIPVPAWSNETGKLEYHDIPVYSVESEPILDASGNETGQMTTARSFTMSGIYRDAAKTQVFAEYTEDAEETISEGELGHSGRVDEEKGIALDPVCEVYTTWREGLLYRVTTAQNFSDNIIDSGGAGRFVFKSDIDFAPEGEDKVIWQGSLLAFGGTLEGNGKTVRHIESIQTGYDNSVAGGVFGSVAAGAVLSDIRFEDVSFTLSNGTMADRGYYGLLAGTVDGGATLDGVSVTGVIHIGDPYAERDYTNYTLGLVCGNILQSPAAAKIAADGIQVTVDQVQVEIDPTTFQGIFGWKVRATVNGNGTVTLAENEDTASDPNLP